MDLKRRERYAKRMTFALGILLTYIFAGNMISIYSTYIPYRDILRVVITILGFLTIFRLSIVAMFSPKNIILPMILFVILAVSTTVVYYYDSYTSFSYAFLQCTDSIMWVAVFALSYWIGVYGENAIFNARLYPYLVFIFAYLFLGVKAYSNNQGIALISTAYYALFLLPFVFLLKNKIIKTILIAIIFTTVLLSVKRGGFIAFILAVTGYYIVSVYVSGRDDNRKRYRIIATGFVAAIALYALFEYYISTHSIGILDRLLSLRDDGGSGRTEIWAYTWEMIKSSNLFQLIFGHGFNTVYLDSALSLSAHNDLLEAIYDYGIAGLIIYAVIIKRIFGYYKLTLDIRKDLAPAFASSIIILISMSAGSH